MSHGGKRLHAGRKKGSGRYGGEKTRAVRVPISRVDDILRLCEDPNLTICSKDDVIKPFLVPLYHTNALVSNYPCYVIPPLKEFYWSSDRFMLVQVSDDSPQGAGINKGDKLIVDTHQSLQKSALVAAVMEGQLVIRWLVETREGLALVKEAADPYTILLEDAKEIKVLGVVTTLVRDMPRLSS